MARQVTVLLVLLAAGGGLLFAEGRLAVLEFFGRPSGGYCSAAGPAMLSLQQETAGRAVLLEYDYDRFNGARLFRFWATGVSASSLPLVMVGSGYRVSHGQADYLPVYRNMILDELDRPARASLAAAWRRSGTSTMRTYVTLSNTGNQPLRTDEEARVWVVAYERARIGVSATWVRGIADWRLAADLAPGEAVHAVVDVPGLGGVSWDAMAAVALVESRPGGAGAYDMAQATESLPVALSSSPRGVMVHPGRPAVDVQLAGPHVLEWTAAADVPWLEVSPASGSLPAVVTVTLHDELRSTGEVAATVTVHGAGDSMDLETTLPVTVGAPVRQPSRRLRPDG